MFVGVCVDVGVSVFVVVCVGVCVVVGVLVGVSESVGVGVGVVALQSHCGSLQGISSFKNPQSSLTTETTHSVKHNPTSSGGIFKVIVEPNWFTYTNVHPPNGADCNL